MTWQPPSTLYNTLLDYGTPVSSVQEDSGYSVLNVRDWRTYTYWRVTGAGPFYITVDCGSARLADTLAIISHNLGSIAATVSLECSSDNFAAETIVALAGFVPGTDKIIYKTFASQTRRYWRLKITLAASASPRIGVLCFGQRLEFPEQPEAPFDPIPQKVQSDSNVSQKGNLLGVTIDFIEINPRPQWKGLDPAWIKNYFDPFWDNHASQCKPFFWAWEPGEHADEVFLLSIQPNFTLDRPYESGRSRHLSLDMVGIKEA